MKERHLFEEDYIICGILGRGKFATVYKCMQVSSQQYYAAKILNKKQQSHIDTEISILTQFRHNKNIVSLHEVYQDSSETVLVLELVQGGELLALLGKVLLTEHDMTHLLKQLCSTLYCLHYKHIVHMDVKPENILVCTNLHKPALKLVDFGLARILQNSKGAGGDVGQIGGTPEFLAPEMLRLDGRDAVTVAVDMWCVGVTTYILLTGISPFQGEDDSETISNIFNCSYYTGEELFGGYSRDALDFISKLLVSSPRKRLTAEDCLRHPWLSKKKRCKQRQYPLNTNVLSSVGVVSERCINDTMAMIRVSLEALSVAGANIKPSSIVRSYKSSYKT